MHDPTTWPKQAKMASLDQWDKLIKYQRELDGGKANSGDGDTQSKVEKFAK